MTDAAPSLPCEVTGRLSADDVDRVQQLVEAVETADGTPPLSDHVRLHMRHGGDDRARNLLVRDTGEVVAYAHLDVTDEVEGSSAELAVLPAARGRGLGRALVQSLVEQSPDARLRLWAHGDSEAAAALAGSMGFSRSRVLLQMRRSLDEPLPEPTTPDGVRLRTFVVGEDEQAWTDLNNRAFAEHPDQGGWGVAEVELREGEPWFDPAGFFLAERNGALVGFHWTKVHGGHGADEVPEDHPHDEPHEHHDHPPIGEVYVVGVDPAEQGRGLGPWLTLVGLRSLQQRGLGEVLLYVDESNVAAVKTYERLGFGRHAVDVMYRRG